VTASTNLIQTIQILILTMKKSLPAILRFMVCTIILYLGFLIAGWVIIGPYSIKVSESYYFLDGNLIILPASLSSARYHSRLRPYSRCSTAMTC